MTLDVPSAKLCRCTPPRRSVWMIRPSGSWSKPTGSLRFGWTGLHLLVVGEHGRAAVAVVDVGRRRPTS